MEREDLFRWGLIAEIRGSYQNDTYDRVSQSPCTTLEPSVVAGSTASAGLDRGILPSCAPGFPSVGDRGAVFFVDDIVPIVALEGRSSESSREKEMCEQAFPVSGAFFFSQ